MLAYLIRRLLLIIPTLLGIMVINFTIIQFAPGGPVEQIIAQLTGTDVGATARIGGGGGTEAGATRGGVGGGGGARPPPPPRLRACRHRPAPPEIPTPIAARRGSTPNSSNSLRKSSDSTNRCMSVSSI
jgi:hypothetical protein